VAERSGDTALGVDDDSKNCVTLSQSAVVSNHTVRQDASQIALQYQPNFGLPAQIQGYDKNAVLQWSQELPIEFGMAIVCYHLMEYDSTGSTLYFGTAGPYTAANEAYSYLYAIDARSTTSINESSKPRR